MIIWLNGAFGSGKTTTAFELHHMLKDSFVYDPEKIGYFLMRYEPREFRSENFQDKPLWQKFNYEMIKNIALNFKGTIIIPMTIINEDYYHEIISKLRNDGIRIDHYVLAASEDTLKKRGRSRLCFKNSWSVKQIPFCVTAFQNPIFENHINTDLLTLYEVIDIIVKKSNLDLLPDKTNNLQKWVRRKKTQLKHIKKL
ncbi:MAG: ATP-binding tunicamycin resistance protein [Clostridia bacterium]|jgi:hypothetical protein|nr:ATP-binding tunicamycin resistance protein [Clostridia bacterium]